MIFFAFTVSHAILSVFQHCVLFFIRCDFVCQLARFCLKKNIASNVENFRSIDLSREDAVAIQFLLHLGKDKLQNIKTSKFFISDFTSLEGSQNEHPF